MTRTFKLGNLKDAERLAYRAGFLFARNNGGHNIYKHPDGRVLVLPDPARKHAASNASGVHKIRHWLEAAGIPLQ